jgi:hypothetical protein
VYPLDVNVISITLSSNRNIVPLTELFFGVLSYKTQKRRSLFKLTKLLLFISILYLPYGSKSSMQCQKNLRTHKE